MIVHHPHLPRTFCYLALCCLLFSVLGKAAGASGVSAEQAGVHHAALVVRYSEDNVQTSCVSFTEPEISGEELLRRSGLPVLLDYNAGLGGAVCSINGHGCSYPSQDCFCQCQGSQCQYWAYYHWENGGWQYASTGASTYSVTEGAVEGWSWGPGNFAFGVEPPVITFDQVCAAAETPTPTATPTGTATATVPAGPTPPAPRMTFEATTTHVTAGSCAVLSWLVWNADRVTLDGVEVIAQDRREVCPQATQRYVLAATNSAGQTVREITVQVVGVDSRGSGTLSAATATPTLAWAATPQPETQETRSPAQGAVTAAVTAAPVSAIENVVEITITQEPRPVQAIAPGGLLTATPRPRRALGADGRPTPTPILVARAPAGWADIGQASTAATRGSAGDDRSPAFTLALLPGYAGYLVMAASLIAAGAWISARGQRARTRERGDADPGRTA